MSMGNRIILTPERGKPVEGTVNTGETHYPGMIAQMDPSQTFVNNRPVWKLFSRSASGNRPAGPYIVVTENLLIGKGMTDSYAAGEHVFGWIPYPGCELNLLYKNVSGTADDVVAGDLLEADNTTGKVIVATGSPQTEVAQAMEAVVDPIVDTLIHAIWHAA